MKGYIKSPLLGALIVGLFAGGIILSQVLGWWATESRKVARKITTGQFAGKADPADIRGSYSLADVEKNFGVPVKELAKAFGLEQEKAPASIRAKDLEGKFAGLSASTLEIGTDSLRLFVALYVGIPYKAKESTGLPDTAYRVLKEAGKLKPEEEQAILPMLVRVSGGGAAVTALANTSAPAVTTPPAVSVAPGTPSSGGASTSSTAGGTGSNIAAGVSGSDSKSGTVASGSGSGAASVSGTEPLIKGKTTFKEVLAWGVTKAQIEKVLGRPMPPEGTVIKDWCTSQGLEFGTIRDALQKLKP